MKRSLLPTVALATALAVAGTTACAVRPTGYHYVRHRGTGTYLRVPKEWRVFGTEATRAQFAEGATDAQIALFPFMTSFSAERDATAGFDPGGEEPAGLVQVRELTPDERDGVSMRAIRNSIFDLEAASEAGALVDVEGTDINEGGVRGQRIVFTIQTDASTYTVNQTALLDPDGDKFYLLLLGCERTCYERNKRVIDDVADSLTIKER